MINNSTWSAELNVIMFIVIIWLLGYITDKVNEGKFEEDEYSPTNHIEVTETRDSYVHKQVYIPENGEQLYSSEDIEDMLDEFETR